MWESAGGPQLNGTTSRASLTPGNTRRSWSQMVGQDRVRYLYWIPEMNPCYRPSLCRVLNTPRELQINGNCMVVWHHDTMATNYQVSFLSATSNTSAITILNVVRSSSTSKRCRQESCTGRCTNTDGTATTSNAIIVVMVVTIFITQPTTRIPWFGSSSTRSISARTATIILDVVVVFVADKIAIIIIDQNDVVIISTIPGFGSSSATNTGKYET